MLNSNSWLQQVSQRLTANGYYSMPTEKYHPQNFMYAAHRSRFEITKFGIAEYFFTFTEVPNLTVGLLQQFSNASFWFAKANKSTSLPDGWFSFTASFAVAITTNLHPQFADYIRATESVKHWGSHEMSAVFDLANGGLYYYEGTPLWGAAYYRGYRKEIRANLAVY